MEPDDNDALEDSRTQRRRLAAVWLSAGSAVAAMVFASWNLVFRLGALPGGDMLGHAAAAHWLRTLDWWDWRGWSDWFFGGQAMGVNYPPLSHAWLRFTDPEHGQMLAVAVGLLILLPWGAQRLARAVGCPPATQRAAVAAVFVLTAWSAGMHWILSGFHSEVTFFGSWPAMLATVLGLHCAAWAAQCRSPAICGIIAGAAVLLNVSVTPGIAVVCLILLSTSGASVRQALRWMVTSAAVALSVCAWWLVPFVVGWDRLVSYKVPLANSLRWGGEWQAAVLAAVAVSAVWAARRGPRALRRLAVAALAGLLATLVAEFLEFLRPERWLQLPLLVAAVAGAGLVVGTSEAIEGGRGKVARLRGVRPAWLFSGAAFLIVFLVLTVRLEAVALSCWLLARSPRRAHAWGGAFAWAGVLALVPLWNLLTVGGDSDSLEYDGPMDTVIAEDGPQGQGLVYLDGTFTKLSEDVGQCLWKDPWKALAEGRGSSRPLYGLYQETSFSSEFISADVDVRSGLGDDRRGRPDWLQVWKHRESPSLNSIEAAAVLGAKWYASCDAAGNIMLNEIPVVEATGIAVSPFFDENSWHNAAVEWWISTVLGSTDKRIPAKAEYSLISGYPYEQSARGVALETNQDTLIVRADSRGWAWLKVPFDPWWKSTVDTPVLKGGPGHLVVWVEPGITEFRWAVPRIVDILSVWTTLVALVTAFVMIMINRSRGFDGRAIREGPLSRHVDELANIVDAFWHDFSRWFKRSVGRRPSTDSDLHESREGSPQEPQCQS